MKKSKSILLIVLFFTISFASDHGIYLKVVNNAKADFTQVRNSIKEKLDSSGFVILNDLDVATPDIVREDKAEHCGYHSAVILFTSDSYQKMLTSYGNKYLVAGLLRIGVYEDPSGLQIQIVDPETINRIIFNDLDEKKYDDVVNKTKEFKEQLVSTIHSLQLGENVSLKMEPIRSDEDIREASKDMFMMVGPMTFFEDEDQFPVIYREKTNDAKIDLAEFVSKVKENLKKFRPSEDDVDYNWCAGGEKDLKWQIVGEMSSTDSLAVVLGISRPRTEALSFHIAGNSRMEDNDLAPGLDHVAAYPIEVLVFVENGELKVMTQREMFRMDMYFWDAGKMAFMSYKNMPGMLDESIKKALLNIYEN